MPHAECTEDGRKGRGRLPDSLELPVNGGLHKACPVCGGGFEPVHVNRYERLIAGCRTCAHHFVVNPFTEQEVAGFYQGFGYFTKNCGHQGITSLEDDAEWKAWVAYRVAILERDCMSRMPRRTLDILEQGCLEGRVLDGLAKLGHRVVGCDVNAGVARAGREHFGIDIRVGSIETCGFAPRSFDLVFSFHTLEHLRDPVRNLAATKATLKPGGMVYFEVPLNETAYENRDHLHFFSLESIDRVMKALFKNFGYHKNAFRTGGGEVIESILVFATKD